MDNSEDELNFSSVSEDDLGIVDNTLSVDEVSSSSSDDMNTSSDESENEGEKEMDIHAWGQNKKNYYGGIEDDINEDGLEMQETRELERNQLEALKEDDFAVSEDEDEEDEEKDAKMNLGFGIIEEEVHKDITELSDKDINKILRKENPELFVMLPDLQTKLKNLSTIIKPLGDDLKKSSHHNKPLSAVGEEYLDTKIQTYLNYCMMIGSYMLLKSEGKNVRDHPVMKYLVKARTMMDKMEEVDKKIGNAIFTKQEEEEKEEEKEEEEEVGEEESMMEDDLREEEEEFSRLPTKKSMITEKTAMSVADEHSDIDSESEEENRKRPTMEDDDYYKEMVSRKKQKMEAKEERKKYLEVYVNDDFVLGEGESRKATQKILKNRGLVPSRPKENRNPRVKKRRRYEKALKNRKGQVAALRTNEADQYQGEKSGIRSDVTHSRVFR